MKITQFAVKYPVSVCMLTLGITLLGIISYCKLGTDLFPDLRTPALYIQLQAGERPPEEMEKQFVEHIESIAARQDGVSQVTSSCEVGSATVTVNYDWEQDMDEAFLDLSRSMSAISQNNGIESLTVSRHDANASPVMTIALISHGIKDMNELRQAAENHIRSELVRLDGVADIQLDGEEEAYVKVQTDPYTLQAFGLTTNDIASKIQSINQNVSGGSITYNNIEYTIKGVNMLNSMDDIAHLIVAFKESTANGVATKSPVYLKDIATVSSVNKEPENMARFNGDRCIALSIYKENQYNTVKVVESITEKLEKLQKNNPDYEFHIIENQGTYIENSIGEVEDSALLGILLAVIILYVFLRRLNTTLIVSISIPVSIIFTFNLMYFNGLSINIMTLGGLALGAGMLVDNAIVVVENIFRHRERGMSATEAAITGASEVASAITASTLTTIVVFLPIVYIQGSAGELFKEQAWTVTFSLLSSLFVALLFMPMLASKFLIKNTINKKSLQINGYGKWLNLLLDKRKKVIGTAAVFMLGSYLWLPFIGMEFMPKAESNDLGIHVNMESGTRLATTDRAVQSIEQLVRTTISHDDVEWIYTLAGTSSGNGASNQKSKDNEATVHVRLRQGQSASTLVEQLAKNNDNAATLSFNTDQSALQEVLGSNDAPLVVEVKGDDLDMLEDICQELRSRLDNVPGLFDLNTSLEQGTPEVDIHLDRLRCGINGIEPANVASQVQGKLEGTDAGSYETKGENIDIQIKLPETVMSALPDLEIVQNGQSYRLCEIADIQTGYAPREIRRINQNRVGRITAQIADGHSLSQVVPAVQSAIDSTDFPAKYSASITGEEQRRAESFDGLGLALMLSILLVYMVMASQFESLKHPFVILLSIPLAFVGSIWAFALTGQTLNMMAFIGLIMLAGIAVNSSIILIDRINQLRTGGLAIREAIVEAGQQRIRPILMTTATTVLALLPMCFGFGEGASLRSPMAVAVIGGLVTSTALTLIVIPCIYYWFNPKKGTDVPIS